MQRDHVIERRSPDAVVGHPSLMAPSGGRFGGLIEEVKHLRDARQRASDQPNGKLNLRQERDPNVVVCDKDKIEVSNGGLLDRHNKPL